jgi:hypothetical protein
VTFEMNWKDISNLEHSHLETVHFWLQVCDIRGISPSLYSETINTPASSSITEENKAVQPENISTSHTTTWRASGDKRTADITVSDGTVDNIAFTLNEARHTHHSETELHM